MSRTLHFEFTTHHALIVGMLLVCWGRTAAQDQHLNHYAIRNYSIVDGLPQSQVTAMVEDKNGYLWLGTQGGGVARFDGRNFQVYTTLDGLLENFVVDILIDVQQNIWIVHHRGVTRYDGLHFTQFAVPGMYGATRLRTAFARRDTVFALTNRGHLAKFYKDSVYYWDHAITQQRVMAFQQAPGGEQFFMLADGTLLIWQDHTQYTEHDAPKAPYTNFFLHGQEVWMQNAQGIYRFDDTTRQLVKLPLAIPYQVLAYDAEDEVFLARDVNQLFKIHWNGTTLQQELILKDANVMAVLKDREHNLWFASDGAGLFKYYFKDFDRYYADKLHGVMAIQRDYTGTVWLGSMTTGLWRLEHGSLKHYPNHENKYYPNSIYAIQEDADRTLWVASKDGLGRYVRERDTFSWYTRRDGLANTQVMAIAPDDQGGLWVGTQGGVDYFDGTRFTRHYDMHDGLKSNTVWSLHYMPANQTLYVGNEFGVDIINALGEVSKLDFPELQHATVLNLTPCRDSLLAIGSSGSGVLIYNPHTRQRTRLSTREGLNSDFIYFVGEDETRHLWIGMGQGISRVKLNDYLEVVENLHYDYDNGLTGVEANQNAIYMDRQKKYFGLIDGLYEWNGARAEDIPSFDLHLTDVSLQYGESSAREYAKKMDGFFKIPHDPVFPSDQNHITFHFNRVDKRYPKSVRFKYLLQHFDKTWSQPASTTMVTYSNLPPGRYCFRAMATNAAGNWSNEAIAYWFTIRQPFYQTASFIAGLIIFVAGSITLLMYLRVRQRVKKMIYTERIRIEEVENLRKEIARDFHDEMGNQLTRIINYVSLLKLNGTQDNSPQTQLYAKVEDSAKTLYAGTRDFIWAIDPMNDELSQLFIHLRDFGVKLFEEKNISFRAYNEIKQTVKLPGGFTREANLIFKEAMTNAFKHSGAANVSLKLMYSKEHYEVVFEDDGGGFHPQQVEKSNGLKNIRERAEKIGAVLGIQSNPGHGTCVILNFKLTHTHKHGTTF